MHVDLRDHAHHHVGVFRGSVQQGAVRPGQVGRGRDDEHHRHRRIAGSQVRRLDELALRQAFAQRRGHRAHPGHPRARHQHHVAVADGGRIQPTRARSPPPSRPPARSDPRNRRAHQHSPGDPQARDHSRRDPLAMSAPQARCSSLARPGSVALPARRPSAGARPDRPGSDGTGVGGFQPGRLGHLHRGRHPREHRVVPGQEGADPFGPCRGSGQGLQVGDGVEHPPVAHLRADGRDLADDGVHPAQPAQQRPDLCRRPALSQRGDPECDAEQVQGVEQAQPLVGRHRVGRGQEFGVGALEARERRPGWVARVRSAAQDARSRSSSAATASNPIIGSMGTPTTRGEVGAAQPRRRDRAPRRPSRPESEPTRSALFSTATTRLRGGDRVGVLGFDHLRGDVDDDVDVRAAVHPGCHRQIRGPAGAVQCPRHRAATHSPSAADHHPQGRGGPLGDRGHARVGVAGGKACQLVDETAVLAFPHPLPVPSGPPGQPQPTVPLRSPAH